MTSTAATFKHINTNLQRTLGQTAKQPEVKRAADYYLAKITSIKSIEGFLKDDRVYQFAMKAYGLDEMIYAKAFMRKVLTEGVDSSTSFANKLSDHRFKDFATVFNFARYGGTATAFSRTQQGAVDRYVRQTLEADAGRTSEGVRLALYFERTAPDITNPLGLLADKALLKVTQVTLGLPASTSMLSLDRQIELIKKKLDVADFKDTAKLDKFLSRFASLWDLENPTDTSNSVPGILVSTPNVGLDTNTLTVLQNIRLGR